MQTNFLGKSGFTWWLGRIVNRIDPLGCGRCQVRIFGYHGDDSQESLVNIPDSDLPWAQVMLPVNGAKSFMAPAVDDWCVGFFFDGESAQYPCIMGILPGFRQTTDGTYTSVGGVKPMNS